MVCDAMRRNLGTESGMERVNSAPCHRLFACNATTAGCACLCLCLAISSIADYGVKASDLLCFTYQRSNVQCLESLSLCLFACLLCSARLLDNLNFSPAQTNHIEKAILVKEERLCTKTSFSWRSKIMNVDEEYLPSFQRRAAKKKLDVDVSVAPLRVLRSKSSRITNATHPAWASDDENATDTELAAMGQDVSGCTIHEKKQLLKALKESENDLQKSKKRRNAEGLSPKKDGGPSQFYLESKKAKDEQSRDCKYQSTDELRTFKASMDCKITNFVSYAKSDQDLLLIRNRKDESRRLNWQYDSATGLSREEHFDAVLTEMDYSFQVARQEGISSLAYNHDDILADAVEIPYQDVLRFNNTHTTSAKCFTPATKNSLQACMDITQRAIVKNVGLLSLKDGVDLDKNSNYRRHPQTSPRGRDLRQNLAGPSGLSMVGKVQSLPARRETMEPIECPKCNAKINPIQLEEHSLECQVSAEDDKSEDSEEQYLRCICGVSIPESMHESHSKRCREKNGGSGNPSKGAIIKSLALEWGSDEEDGVLSAEHSKEKEFKLGAIPKRLHQSQLKKCQEKNDKPNMLSKEEIRKSLVFEWESEGEDGVELAAYCKRLKQGKSSKNDIHSKKCYMPPTKRSKSNN
ncbi:uncharacterized protein LOC135936584 isoform X2 [Cloeon dipterum]|uniref:uncharacterized protein LOC135936584 isoform X2 n=1 Tax=Cloeon dipterum TaxID=197152 RepID=UPI0032209461